MTAGRSPSSRSPPRPPSISSPAIRPTCSSSRSASAAGSTPPTSSPSRWRRSSPRSRSTTRNSSATRSPAIAAEKAGILKRGRPAIVAPQADEALDGDRGRGGARRRADLFVANRDWVALRRARPARLPGRGRPSRPAERRGSPGRHQFTNAGAAIAALRRAGLGAARRRRSRPGLPIVDWPARLQRLTAGALVAARSRRTPRSGSTAGTIPAPAWSSPRRWPTSRSASPRPLFLIVGMLNTKDPVGFFRPFAGLVAPRLHGAGAGLQRRPRSGRTRRSAARRRARRRAGARCRRGARADRRAHGPTSAAAHPDLRLALSRRRGARRERHAAALIAQPLVQYPMPCHPPRKRRSVFRRRAILWRNALREPILRSSRRMTGG